MLLYHLACQLKPMKKHLGSSINIHCPLPSSCNGEKYNYVHFSTITGKVEVVAQASKYTKNLSIFDDGGDYCCSDHCADNITSPTTPECCTSVTSKILILEYITCVITCVPTFSFTCGAMGVTKSCCSQWRCHHR